MSTTDICSPLIFSIAQLKLQKVFSGPLTIEDRMVLNIIYVCVGTTRSGKIIPYTLAIEDLERIVQYFKDPCVSADDLLDAFAVFDYLALRELRLGREKEIFDRHAETIQTILELQELNEAKARANIESAFDLRDLGKSLIAIEFVDF